MNEKAIIKIGLEVLRSFVVERRIAGDFIPLAISIPVSRVSPLEAEAIRDFLQPLTTEEVEIIRYLDDTRFWVRFEPK